MTGGNAIEVWFALPSQVLLSDYAGAADAFRIAARAGAAIELRTVAAIAHGDTLQTGLGIAIAGLQPLPVRVAPGALVVVCGAVGAHPAVPVEPDRRLVAWLREVAVRDGARVACICSGALLAARAGLLSGRRCTTHHSLVARLRELAPDAVVLDDRVFVEDGNVWTSAGITTGVDLALHLIATLVDSRLAAVVAREMVVYFRRGPDEPALSPWLVGRNHLDDRIHRLQDAIGHAPAEDWPLARAALQAHVSVRTLTRRFRNATGGSLHVYHARLRLALADRARAHGAGSEAAAEAGGFGSARQLRRLRAARR